MAGTSKFLYSVKTRESESEKRSLTSSTTATFAARASDIAHPLPKSLTHTKEFQTWPETDPEGSPTRAKNRSANKCNPEVFGERLYCDSQTIQ